MLNKCEERTVLIKFFFPNFLEKDYDFVRAIKRPCKWFCKGLNKGQGNLPPVKKRPVVNMQKSYFQIQRLVIGLCLLQELPQRTRCHEFCYEDNLEGNMKCLLISHYFQMRWFPFYGMQKGPLILYSSIHIWYSLILHAILQTGAWWSIRRPGNFPVGP